MLFVSLGICVAYLKGCVLQHLQWEHLNQAPDFPFKSRLSFFPNPIFLLNSSRTTQNMARLTGGTCSSASLPSGAHMSVLSGHLQMGPICQEHNSRCSHRPAWGRCTAVVPRARAARWSFGIQDGSQRGPGSPGHRHLLRQLPPPLHGVDGEEPAPRLGGHAVVLIMLLRHVRQRVQRVGNHVVRLRRLQRVLVLVGLRAREAPAPASRTCASATGARFGSAVMAIWEARR
jgi:hypothetical protein